MSLTNFSRSSGGTPRGSKIGSYRRRSTYFGAEKNYRGKAPSGQGGIPAPAVIANALGVNIGMPVHQGAVGKLVNHPDTDVASAAKKLMKKF